MVGGIDMISAGVFSDENIIQRNGISVNNAPRMRMAYFNTVDMILNIFLFLLIFCLLLSSSDYSLNYREHENNEE